MASSGEVAEIVDFCVHADPAVRRLATTHILSFTTSADLVPTLADSHAVIRLSVLLFDSDGVVAAQASKALINLASEPACTADFINARVLLRILVNLKKSDSKLATLYAILLANVTSNPEIVDAFIDIQHVDRLSSLLDAVVPELWLRCRIYLQSSPVQAATDEASAFFVAALANLVRVPAVCTSLLMEQRQRADSSRQHEDALVEDRDRQAPVLNDTTSDSPTLRQILLFISRPQTRSNTFLHSSLVTLLKNLTLQTSLHPILISNGLVRGVAEELLQQLAVVPASPEPAQQQRVAGAGSAAAAAAAADSSCANLLCEILLAMTGESAANRQMFHMNLDRHLQDAVQSESRSRSFPKLEKLLQILESIRDQVKAATDGSDYGIEFATRAEMAMEGLEVESDNAAEERSTISGGVSGGSTALHSSGRSGSSEEKATKQRQKRPTNEYGWDDDGEDDDDVAGSNASEQPPLVASATSVDAHAGTSTASTETETDDAAGMEALADLF